MKDHVRIEELFAARALGGLEDAGLAELDRVMAEHGNDCTECRRFQDEYEEVAGRLAFAVAPASVPEGMEDRVLEAAGARTPAREGARRRSRRRTLRPGRTLGWRLQPAAAAAAAALLLAAGGVGGYLSAPRPAPGLTDAAAYLSAPGIRVAVLEGTGQGDLALAFHPGQEASYLVGSGLARPPQGWVYELWLIGRGNPRPAAIFAPDGDDVLVAVPSDPSTVLHAAVTLERAPGARKPTTRPIFAGTITS
jgi:anti-sigma-K factor RskA